MAKRYINGRMVEVRDANTEAVLETIRPKSATPAHGEERSRRIETTYGEPVEYRDATTGQVVYSGPSSAMTQTVREVWCDTCQTWQIARGIIGGICCPGCNEGW